MLALSRDHLINAAKEQFSRGDDILVKNYKLKIGLDMQKDCVFDLGNKSKIIICKNNSWRNGMFVPKYILNTWNEAMYYFHLIPQNYQKIFFVKMDFSQKYCETLLQYYIRNYYYLIPKEVKCYDYYYTHGQNHIEEYSYDTIKKIFGEN
jgi:hypothetical protein